MDELRAKMEKFREYMLVYFNLLKYFPKRHEDLIIYKNIHQKNIQNMITMML